MKPPRVIYAALIVLALLMPAAAQEFEARALPPDEILTILHMAGLDPIGQPKRSGANYAIRAVDKKDDSEVSLVIDANSGDILSKTPVTTASRTTPASQRAKSRSGSSVAPIIVDEDDSPSSGFLRPLSPSAETSPRASNATRPPRSGPRPDKNGDASWLSNLNIIVDEPGQGGASPTPERQPRRAAPTVAPKPVAPTRVSPKPEDRIVAVPPKPEPLPKPRPDTHIEAVPLPSPAPAEAKRQPASSPLPPPPEHLPQRAVPTVSVKPASPKPEGRIAVTPPKPEPLPKPRPDANIEAAPLPSPSQPVTARRAVGAPVRLTPGLSDAAPPPRSGTTTTHASAPSKPNVIIADPDPDDVPPAADNTSRDMHRPQ